ncbi:hypothetical protein [Enterobacter roggenkampii]|uniref:hypothetical protein n=1 Tax=Enterobacter roggenkampii TaxID=1812935 RepID=UPI00123AAF4B|nr:hypothetical protein [Enterobacter roggenkampii]MBG0658633.1 hypothetical protein [Enterobacter roggenkampii]QLP23511.1 hypothetical protein HV027_15240 [Enterobacter roggenkampii]
MKQFRIFATCLDGAGASIPVTWYGEGSTPDVDVQQMRDEAHGNGWSVEAIAAVQQREKQQELAA